MHGAHGWHWTPAAWQMLRKKLVDVIFPDRLDRDAPKVQPPAKMLNGLNVTMDGVARVPTATQVAHEWVKN
jgi:hypothetical protein